MALKRSLPITTRSTKRLKTKSSQRSLSSDSKSWSSTSLETLPWRSVQMPDRLEDVEGFMGLEEVDDVQVIKDSGFVKYRVKDQSSQTQAQHVDRNSAARLESTGDDKAIDSVEEVEWTGFDDELPSVGPDVVAEPDEEIHSQETRKTKRTKKGKTKNTKKEEVGNMFEAIANRDADEFSIEEIEQSLKKWDGIVLSEATRHSLAHLKFYEPTSIQSAAIPEIIAGHDVIGKASTGSGKTLAFAIPIFEHWLSYKHNIVVHEHGEAEALIQSTNEDIDRELKNSPTALIISPTRELAGQIKAHIVDLTTSSRLLKLPTVVSITGGLSLQKQIRQLKQFGGADIVVATPGRLWELLRDGRGFLEWIKKIKFLVFDEADRVLQEGHFQEVEEVLNLLTLQSEPDDNDVFDISDYTKVNNAKKTALKPLHRQTLVFSATFSKELQKKLTGKLSQKTRMSDLMSEKESLEYLLRKLPFHEEHPKWIDVNPIVQMTENLKEGLVECGNMEKDMYLYYLLLRFPLRTLVFTNSISTVRRLVNFLSNLKLPTFALHSSMAQKARLRSLEKFGLEKQITKKSQATVSDQAQSILISTDVAARGLDIKDIELILHYHVPRSADTYVHRSGRTARASNSGVSILLCAPEEVMGVRRLIGKVHESRGGIIKTLPVDRTLVTKLRTRVELAQKITSSVIAKESHRQDNEWLKTAAEDLGVDYSSDDFSSIAEKGRRGNIKRKTARSVTKDEIGQLQGQLNAELKKLVGSGSRTYVTATRSGYNLAQKMIEGKGHDVFYGEMTLDLEQLFT